MSAGCGESAVAVHSIFQYTCKHYGYAYCFADHEGFGYDGDSNAEFGEFGLLLRFVGAGELFGFVEVELADGFVGCVDDFAMLEGMICGRFDVLRLFYLVGHRIKLYKKNGKAEWLSLATSSWGLASRCGCVLSGWDFCVGW